MLRELRPHIQLQKGHSDPDKVGPGMCDRMGLVWGGGQYCAERSSMKIFLQKP